MMTATKISNMSEIRQVGLKALLEALGPIGMTRFMQQYDTGYGDYTKEKYEQPDMTVEDIDNALNHPNPAFLPSDPCPEAKQAK